ncbi:ras association domain-containing protein 2 isoform X2 [Hirundo rustica]|uniref:ras association domain-containing protein 2 isoform X2 n=1 Tax=Hirundo rustica TaxID=43150 RepID=UPI001A9417DA|nr:ras association domain-containing protein 2 isoform X2 [Hirundo rustica]
MELGGGGDAVPCGKDKFISRNELLLHLKTYNIYYEGQNLQLRHREEEGELIVEGLLNISWGLRRPIRLQMQDDNQRIRPPPSSSSWHSGCNLGAHGSVLKPSTLPDIPVTDGNPAPGTEHPGNGAGAAVRCAGCWKGTGGWSRNPPRDCREKEEKDVGASPSRRLRVSGRRMGALGARYHGEASAGAKFVPVFVPLGSSSAEGEELGRSSVNPLCSGAGPGCPTGNSRREIPLDAVCSFSSGRCSWFGVFGVKKDELILLGGAEPLQNLTHEPPAVLLQLFPFFFLLSPLTTLSSLN